MCIHAAAVALTGPSRVLAGYGRLMLARYGLILAGYGAIAAGANTECYTGTNCWNMTQKQ